MWWLKAIEGIPELLVPHCKLRQTEIRERLAADELRSSASLGYQVGPRSRGAPVSIIIGLFEPVFRHLLRSIRETKRLPTYAFG